MRNWFVSLVVIWAAIMMSALPVQSDIRASGAYWDWQLTNPVDYELDVDVLVLDIMETTRADIAKLNRRNVKTVCYVSVGTAENYRPDYAQFPPHVVGKTYGDWPDEKFVDIRDTEFVLPIMKARFDACAAMGFDAIEPDNMDSWDNETGFPLGAADQIAYMHALAAYAHDLGLEIAQKNAPNFVSEYVELFDFVIVESCFEYDFCDAYDPYVAKGKDVLGAEYPEKGGSMKAVCAFAKHSEIKFIFKARELTAGYLTCGLD